ncbi:uncharacterized protein [Physcomitrium patens]|uniref:Leucine-rich repeat-containing N-terminal plant-type domain-containing protein n=1 Tax=Physcomitrium patens TaxID=3218 RepID=A9T6U7_PHYPA|nr:probable LRR receptor-like serine/threonine-protein kinase At1g34110 [Physcomitrium patens]XP_024403372.1 probable LRR receptor-like serine/threonine-protein kinase At1g34110 [Physcomitrium patens]PNR34070.1 hypothetical protein PHYPA_023886 [Physcomitrium patens]|eukprot:XP_024403371.1 probable LRR receptor-like serine/threonine-protein kinase At1g34110 [Physcomitrella patens]
MEYGSKARIGYVAVLLCIFLSFFTYSAMAQCSLEESRALLKFKSVVLDPRDDLGDWGPESGNCCGWRGVLCSRSGVGGIDLDLDVPIRGRTVTIDPNNPQALVIAYEALSKLSQLVIFRTNWVSWRGPLPLRELSKLPLREIVIRNGDIGNQGRFGGSLQNDISNFAGTLEILVIQGSSYNTGLPSALCKLKNLKELEVSQSWIPNLGPACLGSLTSLEKVRMQMNRKATGGLPTWPTRLPNLKVLDFSNNAHSGSIPAQYGRLANVQLSLAGNRLSSRIPPALSGKPESTFRPGNEGLCGAPLQACPA